MLLRSPIPPPGPQGLEQGRVGGLLKKTVPIWKKEYFVDGAVWVEGERGPDGAPQA